MLSGRPWLSIAPIALVAVAGLAACSGDAMSPDPVAADHFTAAPTGAVLFECPVSTSRATTGTLDALGGSITLDGHRLRLPVLAVALPTEFRLEAPASNYMELDITANGEDAFDFEKAVTITIDYSRCNRSNIEKYDLTVWQIDPVTKALLRHMGGVDDKVARTVTFQTDHLSTYSIAR